MRAPKRHEVTDIVNSIGGCGAIGREQACLLPINHVGPHGWETDNAGAADPEKVAAFGRLIEAGVEQCNGRTGPRCAATLGHAGPCLAAPSSPVERVLAEVQRVIEAWNDPQVWESDHLYDCIHDLELAAKALPKGCETDV